MISLLLVLAMVLAWVPAEAFAEDAVSGSCGYDVLLGITPTQFKQGNTCTRGQVVTFLYRCFN